MKKKSNPFRVIRAGYAANDNKGHLLARKVPDVKPMAVGKPGPQSIIIDLDRRGVMRQYKSPLGALANDNDS